MKVYPNKSKKITAVIIPDNSGTKMSSSTIHICCSIKRIAEEEFNTSGIRCKFNISETYITSDDFDSTETCVGGVIISSTPDPEIYITPRRIDEYLEACENIILKVAKDEKQYIVNIEKEDVLVSKYVRKTIK